jgi:high-affinity Fe2+/Pb2+ permease
MKNKTLIIVVSFLAVIICLILTALLFYAVKPVSLIILSLTIGVITGICIAFLILSIIRNIRNKRSEKNNPEDKSGAGKKCLKIFPPVYN